MPRRVLTSRQERGCAGQTSIVLFIAWNLLMAFVMFLSIIGPEPAVDSAARFGRAIGFFLNSTFIMLLWILGSVVTGFLAMLFSGTTVVEEEWDD